MSLIARGGGFKQAHLCTLHDFFFKTIEIQYIFKSFHIYLCPLKYSICCCFSYKIIVCLYLLYSYSRLVTPRPLEAWLLISGQCVHFICISFAFHLRLPLIFQVWQTPNSPVMKHDGLDALFSYRASLHSQFWHWFLMSCFPSEGWIPISLTHFSDFGR